jgi:hypothetical protein
MAVFQSCAARLQSALRMKIMFKKVERLFLLLALLSLNGCMYYFERGLGGGGSGHESKYWEKNGATHNDVLRAMAECGYTDFEYGYGEDKTDEGQARREECMYGKGFKNRVWGGLCSMPDYMIKLAVCRDAPARPQRDYSAEWEKPWASRKDVLQAMKECGYIRFALGYGNDTSVNAFAAREECMFAKGFTYRSKWTGLCSEPEYRSSLPACKNAPLRPWHA